MLSKTNIVAGLYLDIAVLSDRFFEWKILNLPLAEQIIMFSK